MKIFERYIIRELFPYTAVGLAIITFIILINYIMQLAGFLIRNSVSIWVVLKVIVNLIPGAAIFGVPMAVLFGTILGIGRLSAESEITAFRSCGIGLYKFIKPIIVFAFIALVFDLAISLYWLPQSNHQLQKLYHKIVVSRSLSGSIKPRVFIESIPTKVLYISRVENNNTLWKDVIVFDTAKAYEPSIIFAKSAIPYDEEASKGIHLQLQDVHIYDINLTDPLRRSRMSHTPSMFVQLMQPNRMTDIELPMRKSSRAQNLNELWDSVRRTYRKNTIVFRLKNRTTKEQRIIVNLDVKSIKGTRNFSKILKIDRFTSEDLEMDFNLPQRKRFRGFDLKLLLLKKDKMTRVLYSGHIGHKEFLDITANNIRTKGGRKSKFTIFPDAAGNNKVQVLKVQVKAPDFRKGYQKYIVEVHKKFSVPFACLIFALLGLPLGITSRRAGRSFGYVTSIIVFVSYWYLLLNGEIMADMKKIPPWLGAWGANIVFIFITLFFLYRMKKTKDKGIIPRLLYLRGIMVERLRGFRIKLKSRVKSSKERSKSPRRRTAAFSGRQNNIKPKVVIQLEKVYFRFPNTLDRYVLYSFVKLFFMVLLILYVISVIAQFTEINDEFQANKTSYSLLLDYYKYRLPSTLLLLIPISALVATLATFGIMSRNNETIAMKASGISQYRMSAPIIIAAILLSIVTYNLSEKVVPYSRVKFEEVNRKIRKKEAQTYEQVGRQFLFGKPKDLDINRIFYFYQYNEADRTFKKVSFYDYNMREMKLIQRLSAESANWDEEFRGWTFHNGWVQKFTARGFNTESFEHRICRLDETPEYFQKNWQNPDQMSYDQLKEHIGKLKNKGYDPVYEQVRLHWKLAYAMITIVIVLIGIPFSFRMDNKGSLSGIFISLVIILIFYPLTNVLRQLGYSGVLPPLVAAWAANIFFLLLSFTFMLRMKT